MPTGYISLLAHAKHSQQTAELLVLLISDWVLSTYINVILNCLSATTLLTGTANRCIANQS
jgi:hypothetical protein